MPTTARRTKARADTMAPLVLMPKRLALGTLPSLRLPVRRFPCLMAPPIVGGFLQLMALAKIEIACRR